MKTFKILSVTTKPRFLILGMKHHLVDLYQVIFQIMHLGPKMVQPRGHMFNICLYRLNMEKVFLSEAKKAWSLDIWYVVSSIGLLSSLFKLCPCITCNAKGKHEKILLALKPRCLVASITKWNFTKLDQIMALVPKRPHEPPV